MVVGKRGHCKWSLLPVLAVAGSSAAAAYGIDVEWVRMLVVLNAVLSLCAMAFGGLWNLGLLVVAAGTVLGFFLGVGWEGGFPSSPGLIHWSVACASVGTSLLVGIGWVRFPWGNTAAWVCLSLFCGGTVAKNFSPSGGGVQRNDISESPDGLIVSNRHLLAGEEDIHGARRLEMPGGGGGPWSVGHAILTSASGGAWKVLNPGASFLPFRPGGNPAPFWTYLGGGGGDVAPVTTMRTDGLMGEQGHD